MNAMPEDKTAFFILTAWCTAMKTWQAVPGRYDGPSNARRMATEREIYRVI